MLWCCCAEPVTATSFIDGVCTGFQKDNSTGEWVGFQNVSFPTGYTLVQRTTSTEMVNIASHRIAKSPGASITSATLNVYLIGSGVFPSSCTVKASPLPGLRGFGFSSVSPVDFDEIDDFFAGSFDDVAATIKQYPEGYEISADVTSQVQDVINDPSFGLDAPSELRYFYYWLDFPSVGTYGPWSNQLIPELFERSANPHSTVAGRSAFSIRQRIVIT